MISHKISKLTFLIVIILAISSCNVNRDLMFKTKPGFEFDQLPDKDDPEYRISPNDIMSFMLYSNDGFILIDNLAMMGDESRQGGNQMMINPMMMGGGGQGGQGGGLGYFVDNEGYAKLPIVGKVKVAGFTIWEAEAHLESMFAKYYNKPFSMVRVMNKRVFVYTGQGGSGSVISFFNNNTTLIEVLSMAGGMSGRANASRVKVFRRADNELGRKIFEIDLSTIEGIKYADMVVQSNDVIYVEPMPIRARQIATDIAPYVSILSSITVILAVLGTFN